MTGPTQLVAFVMVRVRERLHKDRTLGAFLIESAFCRVTFKWADGRIEFRNNFPAEEIGQAVAEAERILEEEPRSIGEQWLGGVAGGVRTTVGGVGRD